MQETTIEKVFAVTTAFEGGRGYATLAGDFDGQGISWGFLQWNLGQGTLQRLLLDMERNGPKTFARCLTQPVASGPFHGKTVELAPDLLHVCRELSRDDAVAWARQRQDGRGRLLPHWVKAFDALAAEPGFQAIQRKHARRPYLDRAIGYMDRYGVRSQRAIALFFDVTVQCGSITRTTDRRIGERLYNARAKAGGVLSEEEVLAIIAVAVADQVNPRWRLDVLRRKMTIARGAGVVHGRPYHLERDFGVTLDPA